MVANISFAEGANQDDDAKDHPDFKTSFTTIDEKALVEQTSGLSDHVVSLYALSSKEKVDFLRTQAEQTNVIHCENDGEFIRSCRMEILIDNKLINQQPVNINKIYFRNVEDYVGWQNKKDKFLEKNCKVLDANFYKSIDNLTDILVKEQPKDGKPEEKTNILKKNKVTFPSYIFEIENDRKFASYNCLDSKWSNFVTYRTSEHILDGDCKSPLLSKKLGLGRICGK